MSNLYPNTGAIFPNDRKVHDRSPDFSGDLTMEVSLLQEMIKGADNGLVKIRLAGWRKETPRGWFVSIKAGSPMVNSKPMPASNEDVPF
ncbi:MAG: hypothetical protein RL563_2689 [Pseudomonadota bacterium]